MVVGVVVVREDGAVLHDDVEAVHAVRVRFASSSHRTRLALSGAEMVTPMRSNTAPAAWAATARHA